MTSPTTNSMIDDLQAHTSAMAHIAVRTEMVELLTEVASEIAVGNVDGLMIIRYQRLADDEDVASGAVVGPMPEDLAMYVAAGTLDYRDEIKAMEDADEAS